MFVTRRAPRMFFSGVGEPNGRRLHPSHRRIMADPVDLDLFVEPQKRAQQLLQVPLDELEQW